MSRYLCITVTFLDPLFHGKADDDEPEWPPSPLRLFQAMLAGSRIGCRNRHWSDAKAAAFRWLERREPPEIIAPDAQPVRKYTLYVPNNDMDAVAACWARGPGRREQCRPERLRTQKTVHPHRLFGGQTLHYLWAVSDDEWTDGVQYYAETICREARHLLTLGWGIDQVVGTGKILTATEVAALPGRRWLPWRGFRHYDRVLRVPARGTLDDLAACHDSFVHSISGRRYLGRRKPRVFSRVAYLPRGKLPPRCYAVFELPEAVAFPQDQIIVVAAMLRSLTCRQEHRRDFQEQFKEDPEVYLAGHVKGADRTIPRFSYLPLPTIGHKHADGMIRRLLIAEPYGGNGAHARWAQDRLRGQTLTDSQGNERGVLLDLWRKASRRIVNLYCCPGYIWSSVTPVVLPGFDDGDQSKAERLLFKALQQAGIPIETVRDIFLRKAPYWPGSYHPRVYRRPDYLKNFPAWHVAIRFKEPAFGPLAIGAGRHCGLGILAREEENG